MRHSMPHLISIGKGDRKIERAAHRHQIVEERFGKAARNDQLECVLACAGQIDGDMAAKYVGAATEHEGSGMEIDADTLGEDWPR
ncbi:hypothetical protein D3C71_1993670 [compost metagenome]